MGDFFYICDMKYEVKYWTPTSGGYSRTIPMEVEYTTTTVWAHNEEDALQKLNIGKIRVVYIKQI
jgi:hypothetical protein